MSYFRVNRPVSILIWLLSEAASLIESTLKNLHPQDTKDYEQKQQK